MSANAVPLISPEEYLVRDRAAEFRSEYFAGRMYAMSGGTPTHATIALNVAAELRQALRGSDCKVFNGDVRLYVPTTGLYTYPDAVVYCGKLKVADGQDDILLNPTVIIEVLSKSTEAYDRGFKFAQYRRLESLREYALFSQTEPRAEIFRRQPDGEFKLSEYVGLESECAFTSIGCSIPMSEVYFDITFPPTPSIHE